MKQIDPGRLAEPVSCEVPDTADRFVPHVATVPATAGETVGLFLRERSLPSTLEQHSPRVVLMVHGGFAPSVVAYDLQYRDYSFMAALARVGFDVFALSHTGYALSPRPHMDDPCNVDKEFQALLVPHVLTAPAPPRYRFLAWERLRRRKSARRVLRQRGGNAGSAAGLR